MDEMKRIETAAETVIAALGTAEIGVILGSGLGDYAQALEEAVRLPYAEIPGFPQSTVAGHAGMLCCGVLSAALRPSFLPLSCASLALKGFAIGLAVKQLYLDYAWWGVVCGMIGVILPSCCMLTGLILCFGYGASRLRGIQKASSTREKDENATLMPCVRLTVFLTAMGILAEGVMAQVLLRFLLTFAASN